MRRLAWPLAAILLLSWPAAADHDKAKNSYLKKANQELQVWNAKVDEVQKRSEKAGARTRVELDRALIKVRENLDVFRKKVTEVKGSGEDGWKSLRGGADEAFRDVKRAYREVTSFLEKDKPKEKP